ncbi:MAG: substrate-binding domain-containing protein [Chloroflexi bacterium]|nr:substrate-binding domain-containing protein [Chloroflexota bacterium]
MSFVGASQWLARPFHLINLGYRRIAAIASDPNTAGDDRLLGYQQALTEYDRQVDVRLVAYGDYTMESAYTAMKALIPRAPEAVFVSSDTMALGALRALREAGLRVPADIAVVSHDDLPPATQADPPLTTVRQPIAQSGQLAVERLAELIAAPPATPPKHIINPVELIVRASCGAAQLS